MIKEYAIVLFSCQGFILSLLLYHNRRYLSGATWIALFLFLFSFIHIGDIIENHLPSVLNSVLSAGRLLCLSLVPVTLWLFIYQQVFPEKEIQKKALAFLLTGVANFLAFYTLLLVQQNVERWDDGYNLIWIVLFHLVWIIYAGGLFIQQSKTAKKQSPQTKTIPPSYIIGILFLSITMLVSWGFLKLYGGQQPLVIYLLLSTVLIYVIGYLILFAAVKQKHIDQITTLLPTKKGSEIEVRAAGNQVIKYERSSLTAEKIAIYKEKLDSSINSRHLHRAPDLNLQKLSQETNIPRHHLSELLSMHYQTNFFDFINKLRVEEVKQKLADPQCSQFSILGLAYDAGFQSKSTFHTAFKKWVGISPKEYKERIKTPS